MPRWPFPSESEMPFDPLSSRWVTGAGRGWATLHSRAAAATVDLNENRGESHARSAETRRKDLASGATMIVAGRISHEDGGEVSGLLVEALDVRGRNQVRRLESAAVGGAGQSLGEDRHGVPTS